LLEFFAEPESDTDLEIKRLNKRTTAFAKYHTIRKRRSAIKKNLNHAIYQNFGKRTSISKKQKENTLNFKNSIRII
jgi:hypothetical protein